DQGRALLAGQPEPFLGRLRFDGLVALELQHIAHQPPIALVVLHDEDQLAGHARSGRVKVNVDPLPISLVSQIRPPCSSTNFLASVRPSPVPSRFRAASVPTWRNSSKTVAWSSGAIPMPVSLTATSTAPSTGAAVTPMRPPSGVNFTAFESRLSRIW